MTSLLDRLLVVFILVQALELHSILSAAFNPLTAPVSNLFGGRRNQEGKRSRTTKTREWTTCQLSVSEHFHGDENVKDGEEFPNNSSDDNGTKDGSNDIPILDTSKVRIDRSGSSSVDDLSNRFKYKVQALMGAFDPADATVDNENHNGNILNAMLLFPVPYTFNAVGKTQGDQENMKTFVSQVESIVLQETGELQDRISTQITPRGSKFTKIAVSVEVQSGDMIAAIYAALEQLEMSVMQF